MAAPVGDDSVDMDVKLTPGCIKAMMRGENIEKPVVKFLSCEQVTLENLRLDFYQMLIWDGTVSCSLVALSPQLNYLITSGELQEKSIIRLDQFQCIEMRFEISNKLLMILGLTILVKGEDLREITIPSDERLDGVRSIPDTLMEFLTVEQIPDGDSVDMETKLTPGCIKAMMRGDNIEKPVVQLMGYQRFEGYYTTRGCYRLAISDGTFMGVNVWLSILLNDLITKGELKLDSIIRLDRYAYIEPYGKKMKYLRITELTILVKGNTEAVEEIDSVQPKQVDFTEKLTRGCIKAITQGESIEKPVILLQVFRRTIWQNTNQERYFATISDGTGSGIWILLAHGLNYMITNGELQEYSIIRLDKYRCIEITTGMFKKLILVEELMILVKGEDMEEITTAPEDNERFNDVRQIPDTSMEFSTSDSSDIQIGMKSLEVKESHEETGQLEN